MAPPHAIVNLQFIKGIRTNTHPQLQLEGELTKADNLQVNQYGAVSKRLGYDRLPKTTLTGSTVTTGNSFGIFEQELCLFDGGKVYVWSPTLLKWIDRGKARSILPVADSIIRHDGYQQITPQSAYASGLEMHVWADERQVGGDYSLRWSLIDATSRSRPVSDSGSLNVGTTLTLNKLIAYNNTFLLFQNESNITFRVFDLTTLTWGNQQLVAATGGNFDMAINSSGLLFIGYNNTSVQNSCRTISTAYVVSSATNLTVPNQVVNSFTACADTLGNVHFCWQASDANAFATARCWAVSSANASIYSNLNLDPTAFLRNVNPVRHIAGHANTNGVTWYLEPRTDCDGPLGITPAISEMDGYTDLTPDLFKIWQNTIAPNGTRGTGRWFKRGVGLATRGFHYNGVGYVGVAVETDQQATVFILDQDGSVVTTVGYTICGGIDAGKILPMVSQVSTGVFKFDHTVRGAEFSEAGFSFLTKLGVRQCTLDLTNANGFQQITSNKQLVVGGGTIGSYDHEKVTELNFHLYPEGVDGYGYVGPGALTALGVYQYKVVYRCKDALANDHVSRPSTVKDITLVASQDTVQLKIPTLRMTERSNVIIEVYRTQSAKTLFYKVTSTIEPLKNEIGLDYVYFTDELSDNDLLALEPLYTSSELENSVPPVAGIVGVHKSRVFLAGTEDRDRIWFSKVTKDEVSADFVNRKEFQTTVDAEGGKVTALKALDETLCIFKQSAIYGITGEGPLDSGYQGDYYTPRTLSQSIGCRTPGVICEIPEGLIFPSKESIWLLSRRGGLEPVGLPVKAYDGYSYTSVDRIADENVRFVTREGPCTVYDWTNQFWSVWTGLPGVDSVVYQDKHTILQSDGYVLAQGTSFQDAGANYDMVARTSWYYPTGNAGVCQLDRIALYGTYKSPHALKIELEINDIEEAKRTWNITSPNMVTLVGTKNQYLIELAPFIMCQSFRLTFTATGPGACADWSGIRAEIMQLPGGARLVSTRRAP